MLEPFLRNLENADNTELNRTLKLKLEAKEVSMQRLMLLISLTQNLMNLLVLPCTLSGSLTFCQDLDLRHSRMQILKRQRKVTHKPGSREFRKEGTQSHSQPGLCPHTSPSHI